MKNEFRNPKAAGLGRRKTALVTGANRGIGLEVARQLAKRGMTVYLAARDKEKGEAAAARIREMGLSVHALGMDVADPASVRAAAAAFGEESGRLDVLVNNAGILLDGKEAVVKTDAAVLEDTFRTNVVGAILASQEFLRYLKKCPDSRIINVSSGSGSLSKMAAYAPAYSISKAALNAATRQLSAALQADGIAVNSVCPGWVRTEMGGPGAPRSVEQGAEGIVWLAMDAPQELTGHFVRDRETIAW
jgi:NAD(P)-dependent dehydrogenase (short-subunit alcohol dehydrogenase family)